MEDDEKLASNDSPSGSSTAYRVVRTPSPLNATSPLTPTTPTPTPTPPLIQTITNSLQRKKGRLQRSERLQTQESATSSTNSNNSSATSTTFSAWEALVKESFGQIAWPIKITSWELVDDKVKIVPNRKKSVPFRCISENKAQKLRNDCGESRHRKHAPISETVYQI
uniref:Uncharacterized protein n=1 Tax=Glossina austeni TaxID=7395 RepID=A0A1A9VUN6_GLOAU